MQTRRRNRTGRHSWLIGRVCGQAAVIDGPSRAVGDAGAALSLHLRNVSLGTRHGWVCWGRVNGSTTDPVTPQPAHGCIGQG